VLISPERFINLEGLAKGFAIHPKRQFDSERLYNAIEHLLADPVAQKKASDYQKVVAEWDTPQHIRKFFRERFGGNC
jgi:hypothetical protein